ncbi:MAG: hypothetical protein WCK37_03915 [Candidatus Falkowbacteria bacterium]
MSEKIGEIPTLSEERKGQIALMMMKEDFAKRAISLNRTDIMRKIGQAAAVLEPQGVKKEELIAFCQELINNAVKDLFPNSVAE